MNFEITPLGEKLFKEYMDEWRQEGIEKGLEIAIAIQRLILKKPDWTDQQIADSLDVPVAQVKKVRKALNE